MNAVLAVCGAVSLLGLLGRSQNGGWRVVGSLLLWFAVLFGVAALLASAVARLVVLVIALGGAFAIRSWAERRRPDARR